MGDVGDGGTDTVTKKASAGYHVSKWIILNKMKREIERKKRENDDLRARGIALTDKTEEEAGVEAYWATARPEYFKLTEEQIRALAIMQIYFKTMIQIARSRKTQKAGMGQTHKIVLCQSAVRRFFARREAMALMLAKRSEEKHYTKFCKTMTGKGYTVYMFSKKYGTVSKRTLRFDDDCKNVCYKTADGLLGSTREIDIKEIYQVNKGMSGFGYPKARPKRMGFTFHLAILGDKVCDFEAMSGQELKEMLSGFQKLRLLACSRSCFYIDKSGVPSRAVGSNVKYAIEDTGHKTGRRPKTVSEADLMRFRHACKLLQAEYDRWRRRLDEEKEKFDDEERQAKIAAEELAEYNATHEDEAEVGDEEEDEAGGGGGGGEGEEEGLGGGEEEGEGEGGELSDAEPEAEDEGLGQDEGEERRQQKQRRRKPPPDQAEVDNIRKVVEGMYEQVNPSRLKELPNMFGDWRGLERELLVEVCVRPPPSFPFPLPLPLPLLTSRPPAASLCPNRCARRTTKSSLSWPPRRRQKEWPSPHRPRKRQGVSSPRSFQGRAARRRSSP